MSIRGPSSRNLASLLVALLILGAGLRFHDLGTKGLWSDELFTASMVSYHPLRPADTGEWFRRTDLFSITDRDTFWTAKAADNNPPLFELIGKASTTLFGHSEFALRLPSTLASTLLLVWFAWQFWRHRGRREGAVYAWALVIAVSSPALVEYAQEARAYSVGVLFSAIVSTGLYERARRGFELDRGPGPAELGVFILACYTHFTLLVLSGILLSVYAWVCLRAKDYRGIARLAIVPLAFMPWVILSAHTVLFTTGGAYGWADQARLWVFGLGFDPAAALGLALISLADLIGPLAVGVLAAALFFQVTASVQSTKKRSDSLSPAAWLLMACGLLFLLLVALLLARSGTFNKRHFLGVLPLFILATADVLAMHVRSRWQAAAVGAALLLLPVPKVLAGYSAGKESYREAARWVLARTPPSSPILTSWEPNRNYYRFYLEMYGGTAAGRRAFSVSRPDEFAAVCEHVSGHKAIGVIAHIHHEQLIPDVIRRCDTGFRLVDEQVGMNVRAQRWERDSR